MSTENLEKEIFHDESSNASDSSNNSMQSNEVAIRNSVEITNIASASLRYSVSQRATAAIASAAWIDAGFLNKDNSHLLIDKSKVKRAQENVMKKARNNFDSFINANDIECIFFDGRKDLTQVMKVKDGSNKKHPTVLKEDHYTICMEPSGLYLTHLTIDSTSKKEIKPAEFIADSIMNYLTSTNISSSLKAVGCDSTNLNTGLNAGVLHFLEKRLNKKLIWLICALHTNELPLRHLIFELDGPSSSSKKLAGPIGSILDEVSEYDINLNPPNVPIWEHHL